MNATETHLISKTLANEGGFVDHPSDRGGASNFGITAATLAVWRKFGRQASTEEVKSLSKAEAEAIYLQGWVRHPSLNLHLVADIHVAWWIMDTAVLFGQRRAAQWAQEAARVTSDGTLGPVSIAALNAMPRARFLVRATKLRLRHHAETVEDRPSQSAFLEGWTARALSHLDVLAACVALLMLSGCSYTNATFACSATSGGSVTTMRLGTAIEATAPVCQSGVATVSSDPSQGVGALTKSLGIIERLVAPGAVP